MFKNKRFLITQPMIRGLNGSTAVTLELAKALKTLGAKVTIYTCDLGEPASICFKDASLHVDQASENPSYKLADFDYVWVHSQILPVSLVNELITPEGTLPSFIFLHMSGMDWIPDEKPWIFNLENQLSSLSLFICEEVYNVNKPLLSSKIPTGFFRNPAPMNYVNHSVKKKGALKKLLIVSAHPPKEVLEAKKLLQEKCGIKADTLGEGQERYELISKDILESYDAVLTIAKTVQYCLVSGLPVYVYDSYGGGPGWLSDDNFEKAKVRNFSGYQNSEYPDYEGGVFHRKTAQQIVDELMSGYRDSLAFHEKHLEKFVDEFTIEPVLSEIFSKIKPRKVHPFSSDYAKSVIAAELFATNRFLTGGVLYDRDQTIRSLVKDNEQLHAYKRNAEEVFNSKSYRLFNKTIKPYRIIRERMNK